MTPVSAAARAQPEPTEADDAAMAVASEPRPTFLLVAPVPSVIRQIASRLASPHRVVEHLSDRAQLHSVHNPARHCAVVIHAGPGDVHRRGALDSLPSLRERAPARAAGVVLEPGDEDGVRHVVRQVAIPLLRPLSVADIEAFAFLATSATPIYRVIHQCMIWVALESRISRRSVPGRILDLASHGASEAQLMTELHIGPESLRKHIRTLRNATGMSSLADILALILRLAHGKPNDWLPPLRAARRSDPAQPPAVSSMMFDDVPSTVRPKPKKQSDKTSRFREGHDEPKGGA